MERCPLCGQSYGITHTCPGIVPALPYPDTQEPAPSGFAPAYYFHLAVGVARLEDDAILRASRDPNALLHGTLIWLVGQFLLFAGLAGPVVARAAQVNWPVVFFQFIFVVILDGAVYLAQYAVCHLLARWWLGARGTYLGILRAMLLGSVVTWPAVIPFFGIIVAGLWAIAVLMRVFEEVDQVERLKAFTLAVIVGVAFQILLYVFLTPKHY
jgi:hypothetical protein